MSATPSVELPVEIPAETVETPNGFAPLGLTQKLLDSLVALGYNEPTPIQKESIPPLLAGRDLIGLAATGTGKTAAFALPIVQRVAETAKPRPAPTVLVLVPTRELAIQVAGAFAKYGKPAGVTVAAIYGGAGFGDQVRAIRQGADVIVATPGRALDHLRRGTMALDQVAMAVLDEADEMLDMGFAEDIDALLSAAPPARQTMLFSATMPSRIVAIADKHLKNPVRIEVARAVLAAGEAPKVRQTVVYVHRDFKAAAVARLLEYENPTAGIVFCRTRHEADSLADELTGRGFRPESLHGGLSQEQRDRVMRKFRTGSSGLLIATDVAARGLDISHLSHVVNFGAPQTAETYTHRIGRVGRAGREGVAITVADARESHMIRSIERGSRFKLTPAPLPNVAELEAKRLERTRDAIRDAAAGGNLDHYKTALESLIGEFNVVDLALAATKLAHNAGRSGEADLEIPAPPAPREPRGGNFGPATGSGRGPAAPVRGVSRGMARLFLSAGRDAGFNRRDIVAAIESEVGLGSRDIGPIDIAERFTLIDVPDQIAEMAIENLSGIRIRGRRVAVRRDRAIGPPA